MKRSLHADDDPGLRPEATRAEPGPPEGILSEGEAMRAAAFAVSTVADENVFRALVTSLARILRTDLAFIALPVPAAPARLRMLAFYVDGRIVEDFDYALAGTPCETVIGQQYRVYASDLTRRFPRDDGFARLGLVAYAGYPLSDAHGGPLGIISVVSRGGRCPTRHWSSRCSRSSPRARSPRSSARAPRQRSARARNSTGRSSTRRSTAWRSSTRMAGSSMSTRRSRRSGVTGARNSWACCSIGSAPPTRVRRACGCSHRPPRGSRIRASVRSVTATAGWSMSRCAACRCTTTASRTCWPSCATSASAAEPKRSARNSKHSCARRRKWKPSASSPEASRTTSTTFSPASSATRCSPSSARKRPATARWSGTSTRPGGPRSARATSSSRC